MDYIQIYDAFINDRRSKQPERPVYFETHHIVPRSMGGGDEPENLIRLTPEDHFFAHLLLAKAYRGKMSNALWRMIQCSDKNWGRKEFARRSYGLARRIVAQYLRDNWTADRNPLFNGGVIRWVNYRTGETRSATLYAMHSEFGGSRGTWTMVATGYRPSVFGWLPEARASAHKRSEKGKTFSFVNRDGRRFEGTQQAFCKMAGVSLASGSRVVRQRSVTVSGWRLEGVKDRVATAPKDGSRGPNIGKGKIYRLCHRDGREFCGNAEEFRLMMKKPVGFSMSVRLSGLRRGASPSLYGWYLADAKKRTQHFVV